MKHSFRKPGTLILLILLILWTVPLYSQDPPFDGFRDPPFNGYMDHPWVDSVLSSLAIEERIAQSLFLATGPGRGLSHYHLVDKLVREAGVGGLVIRPGSASSPDLRPSNMELVRYFRSAGRVPLTVILDGPADGSSGRTGFWPGSAALQDFPGTWTLAAGSTGPQKVQLGAILASHYGLMGAQLVLVPASEISLPSELQEQFRKNHILLQQKSSSAPALEGFTVIDADPDPAITGARIDSLLSWDAADTSEINRRARTVLAWKYWSGLHRPLPAGTDREADPAGVPETRALIREIYANSLTVLNNRLDLIPLKGLDTLRIACISITGDSSRPGGPGSLSPFQEMAANYTRMDRFYWNPEMGGEDSLLDTLSGYDVVLAGVGPGTATGESVPLADRDADREAARIHLLISSLSKNTRVIAAWFTEQDLAVGPGSALGLSSADGLILAYGDNAYTEELAAQLIFGGIGAEGKLPLALGESYPAGSGIPTPAGLRLQYAFPENAGVSSLRLNHLIDSVVQGGLKAGAFPGCEVIAAKDGKVIFRKTYGHQTYDQRIDVQKGDLYDLASVTKVSGPLPGLMVLEGMGRFSHTDRLGKYVPAMRGSDKADLRLKDILAHQAGLYPWIPYWQKTVKRNGSFKRRLVRSEPSEKFSMAVADHLYLKDRFRKKIYRIIRRSELGEKEYLYSGLAFFLFPGVIEDLSGEPYEEFLGKHIYHRLGAWNLVYNPLRYYPLSSIAPTEYDSLFRKQQIRGYVHDESAATMGGFSGNAGLFATAGDLLKLIEMYRRMGSYGGEQIIPEAVLREYTGYQFPERLNRRGLGFDKPLLDDRDGAPDDYPCPGASPSSFGHSGFTGTFVWADPEQGISYVFLSNRVYPTRTNNLISEMNIRTEVLQAIYDSIKPGI